MTTPLPLARPAHWPDTVYVARDAETDAMAVRVISRLRDADVEVREELDDPLSPESVRELTHAQRISYGKRALLLKRYQGSWLRACPGTNQHVCCNLWTVNPGEGCPLDCTYCYLQSYLSRNPSLKIYTNTDEMCRAIAAKAEAEPKRFFRIGTGEVVDSLIFDDLTDLTLELVPFFARVPNIALELKTKSKEIKNLLALEKEHRGKTVVSWSVNARRISDYDERGTASLDERIEAASQVIAAGYRVGFHFDPLVYFDGWEDGYLDAIQQIFSVVPVARIAWISISTLRYRPEMQQVMQERFPESKLPFGEQFLAKDNKMRYIQPLRFKMERFLWNELKRRADSLPVYMCMESAAAWRGITGGPPVAGSELVEIFSRKGRLPVIGQPGAV